MNKLDLNFLREIVKTFGAKVAASVIGLLTSVLIARALGPDGRGAFAAIMTFIAIGMQFANLGLHSSNSYYLASNKAILNTIIGNSVFLSVVLGTVTGFLLIVTAWLTGILDTVGVLTFSISMLSVPIGLSYMLLVNLLVPLQAINKFNKIEFGLKILTCLIVVGVVISVITPSPGVFILGTIVAQIFGVGAAWRALKADTSMAWTVSWKMLFEHIPFAFRAYLASLLAYLLVRSDIIIIQSISGNEEVGYYSVAVAIADMLYLLPATVGLLFFSRLTQISDSNTRRSITWKVVWLTGGAMAVVCTFGAMMVHSVIRLLYGQSFLPAVQITHILLISIIFHGMNNILSSYLAATGIPWSCVWVWVVGVAINIGLNLFFVPFMGGVGAALSSLIAYMAVFVMQGILILREKVVPYD